MASLKQTERGASLRQTDETEPSGLCDFRGALLYTSLLVRRARYSPFCRAPYAFTSSAIPQDRVNVTHQDFDVVKFHHCKSGCDNVGHAHAGGIYKTLSAVQGVPLPYQSVIKCTHRFSKSRYVSPRFTSVSRSQRAGAVPYLCPLGRWLHRLPIICEFIYIIL